MIYDFRKFVYTILSLLGDLIKYLLNNSKHKDCFSFITLLKEIWRVEHFEKYLLLAF